MSSSAVWDVEDDAAAPWYDTDNEEVEKGVCSSPEEAGDMFVEQLRELKSRGTLSAKSVCILAYLAAEAGAVGPAKAKELGCRPAAGHFQRRIDDFTLFKVESERSYDVWVPGHDRLELTAWFHSSLRTSRLKRSSQPALPQQTLWPQCVANKSYPKHISSIQWYARVHLALCGRWPSTWTGLRSQSWTVSWGSSW